MADAVLLASGEAAERDFAAGGTGETVQPCQRKTWVAIELKDRRGRPVTGVAYRIELPEGRVVEGVLDAQGCAGVDGIDPGTCRISFPTLDARAWSKA